MRAKLPILVALAASIFSFGGNHSAAAPLNRCEAEMVRASSKYDVPLGVLYAVGMTESGKKESLQAHAMNIEGRAYYATSLADGIKQFDQARQAGAKLIDIGCMQIDHHFHGAEFASVSQMFDPKANVEYAARFLKTLRDREGNWTMAVARYHAGPNNDPAQKRYVCAVIRNMVAADFGAWTASSRAFCSESPA